MDAPPPDEPPSSVKPASRQLLSVGDLPWLASAVLAAIALRMLWVAYVNPDPGDGRFDDSAFYHRAAQLLAQGAGYVSPYDGQPTAQWPPAYPAMLAGLYKVFGANIALAKLLNVGFGAVTVLFVYLIGRRLFDRRVAYLGAIILAFFPGQIYFSTLLLSEAAFAAVFMLVLLLTLLWTAGPPEARWWQLLLIGGLVGIASAVRSEGVFLALVLLIFWALTLRPWRRVAHYAAILGIGLVLALTPWTARNAMQLNQFVPLRSTAPTVFNRVLDPDAASPIDPSRVGLEERLSTSESFEHQLTHPWEIPALIARRVGRFYANDSDAIRWIQHTPSRIEPPLSRNEVTRWRGLADRYFYAVGAAALAGAAWALIRRNPAGLLLIVAGLGWTLLFGLIPPASRFHFAVNPVISILAGAFLLAVWDEVRVPLARWRGASSANS